MIVYADDDGFIPPASYCESRILNLRLVSGSWRRSLLGSFHNIFSIIEMSKRKCLLCFGYCCVTWDTWNCSDRGRKTGWLQSRKLECLIILWCWINQFWKLPASGPLLYKINNCLSHFQPVFSVTCSWKCSTWYPLVPIFKDSLEVKLLSISQHCICNQKILKTHDLNSYHPNYLGFFSQLAYFIILFP